MNFYIPTYQDCLNIVENNPKLYFYECKYLIDSYYISIFCYRYAKYNNFILPIINKPKINALELKGISFVFDDNNDVKHYLMLNKFWELNQYEHCKYDLFKDKEIKNITTKEDGFLITFIKLPSGEIISQTKNGFDTPENIIANNFINNNVNYYKFINNCIENNIRPIFELVGPTLYVKYNKEDLILIKLRNNNTGEYLNIKDYNISNISVVKEYNYTLDELIELKKNVANIEGWIVHFTDDTLLKIKTDWWINEKNNKLL